ncbi:hypothetical protein ACE5JW_06215 [Acinetobacter radioresistens]|jgi:hypothetical protein|uniref:Lipoprotein n=2 Tax=Acinetobacter radioresistens TaxID=40216 RepID=A0A2T1J2U3_ACIRA|nr:MULTISPECIES: hypothetical protein [Acinetobacter]AWV85358.1 hypothetical protein DOM24_01705 [Acinetobacter radioresistens]EET81025.1 hypothetical protein ACIRA0001_1469 [Acinetobacter radioresistens SK82]EEY86202.1 hypothetical protein HMPREF0018_02036 [Acinetobacter radioresistens SH164]EJO36459.1 putative lipoprotein [Acinetobacter radioresistens WC-A-157]ENV87296.1 hypothetical protein F940_01270 [Acinetobacter radioresistens NIPH 2130]
MNRIFGHSVIISLCGVLLSACQSTQNAVDTVRIKYAEKPESQTNALIYCSGTENCEFERISDIQIVDPLTHRVNSEAIREGIVRLQGSSLSQPNPLYLSVPAKQYEVVIRFYPISQDRAEKLHVIHQFKANQRYTFHMFRDRSSRTGSLLNVSAPDPLCVDLQQEKRTIRRFCRPYNVLTGLGEFVEKKL